MKESISRHIIRLLSALLIGASLYACQAGGQKTSQQELKQSDSLDFAFKTTVKYAKGFSVTPYEGYKIIEVLHPISKDVMAKYVTTLSKKLVPDSLKTRAKVVEVPAKSIACLSTTQLPALDLLGLHEALVGCASPQYIWNKKLSEGVKAGKIKALGQGMNFNAEQIVALSPELLMQIFMDKTDTDGRLSKLGITVLYNNEWKEPNLLGRAEWLKFTALFFCKERNADSIFNQIEQNYMEVKALASTAKAQPKVMYGYDYRGTWYLPQNETYVAQTLRDANAEFKGAGAGNASTPKSFEEVYDSYHDADIWLTTQGKVQSLADFLSSNERYADFRPAQIRQVYCNNKREKATGGNDYWESGIARPDLLLKDMVKLLHPELLPDYKTTYWQHLK